MTGSIDEGYTTTDIDLFQDVELLREEITSEFDTWLTESLLLSLSEQETTTNDDSLSLLNSDIISVNSFKISSSVDSSSSYTLIKRPKSSNITNSEMISENISPAEPDDTISMTSHPSIVYGAEMFPFILSDAFNQGDMDYIRSIILAYMSDHCVFQVNKPAYSTSEFGNRAVVDFYIKALFRSPDAILLFRGVKKIPSPQRQGYYLKIKTHISGTLIDKSDKCDAKESVVELVSPKTSKADAEAIRLAEIIIRQQQKHLQVFFKGFTYLFINQLTHKIENYDMSLSLSSIRAAEL
jgi:hypothetical protein